MIIEAQCNQCHKHIGHASLTGKYIDDDITLVRTIANSYAHMELLCDECRVGRIDLDGGKRE